MTQNIDPSKYNALLQKEAGSSKSNVRDMKIKFVHINITFQ